MVMSGIRRIIRREGTSKLEFAGTTSKSAPPDYVPELIRDKVTVVTDLEHLDKVGRLDPLANFIVYGVAEMIFDDWFVFTDADGNEIMQDVQKRLTALNAKRNFILSLSFERNFGYAYQYIGKSKYIPQTGEGGEVASLHTFNPIQCSVFEYDTKGNPKRMKVELTVGVGSTQEGKVLFLPAKDFIIWNTRPIGRGYTGRSVLEAIWDMLVYIRYIFHSMCWYDMKMGTGLFTAWVSSGFDEAVLAKWDTAFQDVSVKKTMVVDAGEVEDIKYVGPQGYVTDFVAHLDMCMQTLSVPIKLPKDLLMGAATGAVTGSETNLKLGDEFERSVKNSVEEYIRDLVEEMGSDGDYLIEWNDKTAQTEAEAIKIDQGHTQAQTQRLPYMTIDEVREIDGLPPLPDGRGDKLASEVAQINMAVSGLHKEEEEEQSPEEQEKTNNPDGETI